MSWTLVAQVAGLVVLYIGGILGVGYFISNSIGKRIDDLRSQMTREHDALSKKVDFLTEKVIDHVTDYSIHNKT